METATAAKKRLPGRPVGVKEEYKRIKGGKAAIRRAINQDVMPDVRRMIREEFSAILGPVNKEVIRLALHAKYEPSRIAAIREIYDRLLGKAPQAITGEGGTGPVTVVFRWRSRDEVLEIEHE